MRQLPIQFGFIWHSLLLIAICGLIAPLWTAPAIVAGLLILLLDQRLWPWRRLLCASFIFSTAFIISSSLLNRQEHALRQTPSWYAGKYDKICGTITLVQGLPDKKLRIILRDISPPNETPLAGLCVWTWEEPQIQPLSGQQVCLARPVKPVSGFANNKSDSFTAALFAQGIYWRIWSQAAAGDPQFSGNASWAAKLREDLRQTFLNLIIAKANEPIPQSKAILLALLFGDRQYLARSTLDKFASATLGHSLALSGQHLAVAGLIGLILVMGYTFIKPTVYLHTPRILLALCAAIPFALIYLWLGNSPASLQRAAAMLIFGGIWIWLGKPFSGQDLLCAALLFILAFNPLAIFDAGLQMSACCVAIILITWPAIVHKLPKREDYKFTWKNKLKRRILLIFLVSFVIQLSLLPISLARFQIAGYYFPLNLLWLPCIAFLILPEAALALILALIPCQFCHTSAQWLINFASLPCEVLLKILDFLQTHNLLSEPAFILPHWTTIIGFCLLICGLAWLWGNQTDSDLHDKSRMFVCGALLLLAVGPILRLSSTLSQNVTIEALDTGQSQAVFVDLPGYIRILIDGGGSYYNRFDPGKSIVAPYLTNNHPPYLTAVFNSHPDMDHLGGLFYIINNFKAEAIFHNGREARKENQEIWADLQNSNEAKILNKGDKIIIGNSGIYTIDVLHPPDSSLKWRGNGASLILRLAKNGKGIGLFPGDAEKTNLDAILEEEIDATVLIVPHHGSDKNFLPAFYKRVNPSIAIACCGYLNRWHYPGAKTRNFLKSHRIKLFDTGSHGRIKVEINAEEGLGVDTIKALAD